MTVLEPFRRSLLGIPFVYQKIVATSPIVALIAPAAPTASFTVLHLDGTVDWMVAQRKALVAWTGHSLSLAPTLTRGTGIAHWGSTLITGRGLVALAGPGNIYQIRLKADEEYVAHPGNILAYIITPHLPQPYRLPVSGRRLSPILLGLGRRLSALQYIQLLRQTGAWRWLSRASSALSTFICRAIWGDQIFLSFRGPVTLLISSRAPRIGDVFATKLNDTADTIPTDPTPPSKVLLKEDAESDQSGTTKI